MNPAVIVIIILSVLSLIFWRKLYDLFRGRGVYDDLYRFNSKLTELIKLNLPLDQAVREIVNEAFVPVSYRFSLLKKSLMRVAYRISNGSCLGDALDKERKFFPAYYVNMVRIGEAEGDLVGALDVLDSFLETKKKYSFNSYQVSGYFIASIVVIFSVVLFMATYIMPTFRDMFEGMGQGVVSTPIRWIFIMARFIPLVAGLALIAFIGYLIFRKSKEISRYFDRTLIKIPFYRNIIKNYEYMIFCKVMGILLKNYMPLDNALVLASGASSNHMYSEAVKNAANVVEPTFAAALKRSGLFDDAFLYMISLGENTETLPEVFEQMGQYYASNYENCMNRLFHLSEIGTTTLLGIVVGAIAVAAFDPMVKLINIMDKAIVY